MVECAQTTRHQDDVTGAVRYFIVHFQCIGKGFVCEKLRNYKLVFAGELLYEKSLKNWKWIGLFYNIKNHCKTFQKTF